MWSTNLADDTNLIMVPTFCESNDVSGLTNAIATDDTEQDFNTKMAAEHVNDIWQSMDGTNEPVTLNDSGPYIRLAGAPMTITNKSIVGQSGGHDRIFQQCDHGYLCQRFDQPIPARRDQAIFWNQQ